MLRWDGRSDARRLFGTKAKIALAKKAIDANPRAPMAHYALAAAHFRLENFAAGVESFERGLALKTPEPKLLSSYAAALTTQGRADAALVRIDANCEGRDESAEVLAERGCALARLNRGDEACRDLRRALEINPHESKAVLELSAILKARCDWQGLVDLARELQDVGASSCTVIHAKLAGLMGLGRVEEAMHLTDFSTLVSIQTIMPPAEYEDLQSFNSALSNDLRSTRKVQLSDVPRLKMTGGVQIEDLEHDSSPAMSALMTILRKAIDNYVVQSTGFRAEVMHGLLPSVADLAAWALLLGPDDTQDIHYHLNSSVAGVYYVDAPAEVLTDASDAGCLVFPSKIGAVSPSAVHCVKPVPGRLVLFPGYVPHRTFATRSEGTRVSIAFDVLAVSDP